MPSKEPAKGLKPYTVFYVASATHEDIHIDTVLARGADDARTIAAGQHSDGVILHVRGVGEEMEEMIDPEPRPAQPEPVMNPITPLPGARFINGRFLAANMSDDPLFDTVGE